MSHDLKPLATEGKVDFGALVEDLALDVVSRHILSMDRAFQLPFEAPAALRS